MTDLISVYLQASALVLSSFEETNEQTRRLDVHLFTEKCEPKTVIKDKTFKYNKKYKILDFHDVYML